MIVQASEIPLYVHGMRRRCSSINRSGLGKTGLPGCLNAVFSSHRIPMSLRQAVYAKFDRVLQEVLDRDGCLWFLSFWAPSGLRRLM